MKLFMAFLLVILIVVTPSYVLSQSPTATATQTPAPLGLPTTSTTPSPIPTPDKAPTLLDSTVKQDVAGSITFTFLASYSENSTGLIKLIPNADCKITFTDFSGQQNMRYVPDVGYEHTRNFTESVSLSYTVACSHANYAEKTQTRKIEVEVKRLGTEIILLDPKDNIKTKDVVFVCEARGLKPIAVNLYSDTSGEWK